MLDRYFQLTARQTHPGRELLAAVTTFLTASYILFVQPAVLSKDLAGQPTGLDYDAVLLATCLASALATLIMGLYANYPIAQAPGMGQNFFFVATIGTLAASQIAEPWRVALGIVFVSGVLFLGLSLGGVRLAIFDAVSGSLRHSIAVGIGLFIAFIGLRNAGVIVDSPGTLVKLNDRLWTADQAVFWFGFLLTVTLHVLARPRQYPLGHPGRVRPGHGTESGRDAPEDTAADAPYVQESRSGESRSAVDRPSQRSFNLTTCRANRRSLRRCAGR